MRETGLLLAVDLGASKTNLGLYPTTLPLTPVREGAYKTKDFPDATTLLAQFLADCGRPPLRHACLGVPGPVFANQSATTNLPWLIDGNKLSADLGIAKVLLVNDLMATAAAVVHLAPSELFSLNPGKADTNGNVAVLSPGTGLGEAFLTVDSHGQRCAHASEGGHSDFAPNSLTETELLIWLREIFGHVSYEQVCSSLGLINIFNYLRDQAQIPVPAGLAERFEAAEDPSRVIIESSLDPENYCELCQETLKIFIAILGAEAGNLALKFMATGGIYIGGGITPRITSVLDSSLFLKNFLNKGRLAEVLSDIPVRVIMNHRAPVLGAAHLARQALAEAGSPA
ncbi:MAG: glucokinase [Desulfobulbaceae bacterium]|nr:glucokinase [Desulfobulbaceae bacterium]